MKKHRMLYAMVSVLLLSAVSPAAALAEETVEISEENSKGESSSQIDESVAAEPEADQENSNQEEAEAEENKAEETGSQEEEAEENEAEENGSQEEEAEENEAEKNTDPRLQSLIDEYLSLRDEYLAYFPGQTDSIRLYFAEFIREDASYAELEDKAVRYQLMTKIRKVQYEINKIDPENEYADDGEWYYTDMDEDHYFGDEMPSVNGAFEIGTTEIFVKTHYGPDLEDVSEGVLSLRFTENSDNSCQTTAGIYQFTIQGMEVKDPEFQCYSSYVYSDECSEGSLVLSLTYDSASNVSVITVKAPHDEDSYGSYLLRFTGVYPFSTPDDYPHTGHFDFSVNAVKIAETEEEKQDEEKPADAKSDEKAAAEEENSSSDKSNPAADEKKPASGEKDSSASEKNPASNEKNASSGKDTEKSTTINKDKNTSPKTGDRRDIWVYPMILGVSLIAFVSLSRRKRKA